MKVKENFWFFSLCALWIMAANTGYNIWTRIALGANAVIVLLGVIQRVRGYYHGRG